jgi:hypothetical protein
MTSLACAASVVIGVIRKASFGLYFRSIAGLAPQQLRRRCPLTGEPFSMQWDRGCLQPLTASNDT